MPWILNEANNPVLVALGSKEFTDSRNFYLTEQQAKEAQQKECAHETRLGHSGTGKIFCADCSKPFN